MLDALLFRFFHPLPQPGYDYCCQFCCFSFWVAAQSYRLIYHNPQVNAKPDCSNFQERWLLWHNSRALQLQEPMRSSRSEHVTYAAVNKTHNTWYQRCLLSEQSPIWEAHMHAVGNPSSPSVWCRRAALPAVRSCSNGPLIMLHTAIYRHKMIHSCTKYSCATSS